TGSRRSESARSSTAACGCPRSTASAQPSPSPWDSRRSRSPASGEKTRLLRRRLREVDVVDGAERGAPEIRTRDERLCGLDERDERPACVHLPPNALVQRRWRGGRRLDKSLGDELLDRRIAAPSPARAERDQVAGHGDDVA